MQSEVRAFVKTGIVVESYTVNGCRFDIYELTPPPHMSQCFRVRVTELGPVKIYSQLKERWETQGGARAGILLWLEANDKEEARHG